MNATSLAAQASAVTTSKTDFLTTSLAQPSTPNLMQSSSTALKNKVSGQSKPEASRLKLSAGTIDMIAGSCAGIIGTFVSHPLDTVKVRFQTSQSTELTMRRCIRDIYCNEGVSISRCQVHA